jgi:asparagine synthetase B (glutamine-hydrolysing)
LSSSIAALAIIDPGKGGAADDDGGRPATIVFNGEIYNY